MHAETASAAFRVRPRIPRPKCSHRPHLLDYPLPWNSVMNPFFGMRLFTSFALLWLGLAAPLSAQQRVDVLLRGGTLVDGTGSAPRRADVGIAGDRITFVGDASAARRTGGRTIDVTGLIVAPGFIDPH